MFTGRTPTIDVRQAFEGQRSGQLALVDVREPREYAQGHAADSVNMPVSQVQSQLRTLPADRGIAFICQSGRRSAIAAAAARRAGIDARSVKGGMTAWQRQGLEITSGRS